MRGRGSRSGTGCGSSQVGRGGRAAQCRCGRRRPRRVAKRVPGAGRRSARRDARRRRPGARAGARAVAATAALLRTRIEQVAAGRHERRQFAREQAQRDHRLRDRHALQPVAGEFEQHRRFAFGGEQADLDIGMRARVVPVDVMLQPQDEALHAAIADRQAGAQVADQPAQREQQRGVALDLVAQFDARIEMIRRRVVRSAHRRPRRTGGRGAAAVPHRSAGAGCRAAIRAACAGRGCPSAAGVRRCRPAAPRDAPARDPAAPASPPDWTPPAHPAGRPARARRAASAPSRCGGRSRARPVPRAGAPRCAATARAGGNWRALPARCSPATAR
jgi:hypothetical protein